MTRISRFVKRFLRCEAGATSTEYAVMIAMILLVIIAAVALLGTKVSSTFVDAEGGF